MGVLLKWVLVGLAIGLFALLVLLGPRASRHSYAPMRAAASDPASR